MQLRLIKRALVQLTTSGVLLVGGFSAYVAFASSRAESRAAAVCKAVPVSTSEAVARANLKSATEDPRLFFSSPGLVSAGFRGAMADRWFCKVTIADGEVTSSEVYLLD
jgi:hypothetical protein